MKKTATCIVYDMDEHVVAKLRAFIRRHPRDNNFQCATPLSFEMVATCVAHKRITTIHPESNGSTSCVSHLQRRRRLICSIIGSFSLRSTGSSYVVVIPSRIVQCKLPGHLRNRGNRPTGHSGHMARIICRKLVDPLHRHCGGSVVVCLWIFQNHVWTRYCGPYVWK